MSRLARLGSSILAGGVIAAGLVAAILAAAMEPAGAQLRSRCDQEAVRLQKAEAELPDLKVAPPHDRQIVCITLETNLAFAHRLAAHLKQCPKSPLVRSRDAWARNARGYAAQFGERGCKPAVPGN